MIPLVEMRGLEPLTCTLRTQLFVNIRELQVSRMKKKIKPLPPLMVLYVKTGKMQGIGGYIFQFVDQC